MVGAKLNSYFEFLDYTPNPMGAGGLSEIWRDQSMYIKIDYWFDF